MHRLALLLRFTSTRRPWLGLPVAFPHGVTASISHRVWAEHKGVWPHPGPQGVGYFQKSSQWVKKAKSSLRDFFFFQKLVLEESSSLSAHQLQLFSSVLGWPLHGFCCQGPGLLGSIGGVPAARHGYDADIHADWDWARAGTHESIALSAWLPAQPN